MPRLFSGLEGLLALVRHLSLGTGTFRFQTESRQNVPLHRPSSVEALETLDLIKEVSKRVIRDSGKTGLTRKFSRITRQNLVDESSLIHLNCLITACCPLPRLGKTSTLVQMRTSMISTHQSLFGASHCPRDVFDRSQGIVSLCVIVLVLQI